MCKKEYLETWKCVHGLSLNKKSQMQGIFFYISAQTLTLSESPVLIKTQIAGPNPSDFWFKGCRVGPENLHLEITS